MISKKGVSLPVNVVVMTIIGITIFSLGLGLFSTIYSESDDVVGDLQDRIRTDIAALECDNEEWICSPPNEIGDGDSNDFQIYISNRGDTRADFEVQIELDTIDTVEGITNSCGSVIVAYLKNQQIGIESGHSASIPMIVKATRVTKTPCSFTTTAILLDSSGNEVDKTPIIVSVE